MSLIVIMMLYLGIAVLAAIGTITITSRKLTPRAEQVFFGLILIPIALVYLAFADYFGSAQAWRYEAYAIGVFVILALLGTRFAAALIVGYLLHGAWDLVHEVMTYLNPVDLAIRPVSAIPIAYGVFCAVYDLAVAGYFVTRRAVWSSK